MTLLRDTTRKGRKELGSDGMAGSVRLQGSRNTLLEFSVLNVRCILGILCGLCCVGEIVSGSLFGLLMPEVHIIGMNLKASLWGTNFPGHFKAHTRRLGGPCHHIAASLMMSPQTKQ